MIPDDILQTAEKLGIRVPAQEELPKRALSPVRTTRRQVWEEARALEFRQFQYPEDRERLNAIRALALEQIRDDTPSMSGWNRDRIGRAVTGRVLHADPDYGEQLWKRWTPEQLALEDRMAPLIRELPPRQREAIHLLYWRKLSERQVAAMCHVSQPAVHQMRKRALASLRRAIASRYFPDAKEAT